MEQANTKCHDLLWIVNADNVCGTGDIRYLSFALLIFLWQEGLHLKKDIWSFFYGILDLVYFIYIFWIHCGSASMKEKRLNIWYNSGQ